MYGAQQIMTINKKAQADYDQQKAKDSKKTQTVSVGQAKGIQVVK